MKFNVTGMSCAACSARVEKAVNALDDVTSCSVNLLTNTMETEGGTVEEIVAAVEAAGYGASPADRPKENDRAVDDTKNRTKTLILRLVTSVFFLLILMYVSMGHAMWGWPLPDVFADNFLAQALLQMLLAAIVMVINQRFFISGFKALWMRSPNMDSLVALGSMAAFAYSTYALFAMSQALIDSDVSAARHYMHELYFESAAMILALITIGKMLESHSKGKTTDALKGLMELAPKTATVLRDGVEVVVGIEQVKKGDIFVVRPGESIPVDGVILEGHTAIDESALTGESTPVDKKTDDLVSAATVNRSGFIKCEATRVGEDTTLSQIIKMVSDASASKAPIAKIADKVSGVFVPVVIGVAVVTCIVWLCLGKEFGFALARSISVLVISCPCALGLATPVAIMVGNGVGARHGILFKTATSLEQTGRIKAIALDKTGTITEGKPSVTDVIPLGVEENVLLSYAFGLEKGSEHPLAGAVVSYAEKHNITPVEVSDFQAVPGNGLQAICDNKRLFGGNLNYVSAYATIDNRISDTAERLSAEGKTPLYFVLENQLIGLIAVADTIKEDSARAVSLLKNMGIRVIMLTGDNQVTADAIAAKANVEHVVAGVLPEGKAAQIAKMCETQTTAMVGDGINDAPALSRADIGIAIGAGTDIAMDAADVVLMHSRLTDVVTAVRLSRATLRNIKENLFWAFIYNIIGIPLAAGVFIDWFGWQLSPMFGAAAMSLSSFCVVSNALRLNFFETKKHSKEKEQKQMKITLKVEGMMCPHCEAHVKSALEAVDGVASAVASHKDGCVVIELSKAVATETLKEVIVAQGYKVTG